MPSLPSRSEVADETVATHGSTLPLHQAPPAQTPDRIRVKNRRKRYLDMNPSYFGPQLELADPLLYDRLVRRFQTAAEREQEGRDKGYSGILEADLWRGEAKMEALRNPDSNSVFSYKRGPHGEILQEERDEVPSSKEEGYARWRWEMEARFIQGGDGDFDYTTVDANDAYDDKALEEQEALDRYFDDEPPEFVVGDNAARRTGSQERKLEGETGVQDF